MTQVKTVLGKVGFTPKGTWTAGTTYDRLDVVTYEGSSFLSLVAGNTAETTDATKWQQIAAKGDAGVKGDTGDTGEQGEKGDAFTYDDFTEEQIAALKQPALDAAQVAEEAAAEALNVPKIQDGYFWVWSTETHAYVKTSSQATGQSPKIVDGEWWVYDDATQQYINSHVSASADYELTKEKIEAVFTGDITTHNHATQLTSTLANYVVKETGKDLSTNDYTDADKEKLAGLENYDDTAVKALITAEAERATGVEADKVDKVSGKGLSTNDYTDTEKSAVATIENKVDKETGKGLSTNDYTTAEKEKLSKLNFVPTLTAEPTEDTLTFTDDYGMHTFLVGDLARVYETDDYVFYQLYDITSENKATWKKAGSGGGTIEPETLKLTLTSNQAQPDTSLNGAVIHVKYGDNDTELTWQGETLTTTIPMNMTYTIEFPAVEGYATPATQEYIAIMSNTRQATAAYNTTVMTLTLDSNQTDKSDLAGATLTLSGSISKVLTYSEDNAGVFTQKVPLGEEVTITPSAITGYQTPAAVTKTPEAATDSATLTHNTELVTVTVAADDSASCAGQVVTVNGTEYTYSAPFSVKIAYGTKYSVSVNAKSGYTSPDAQTFTAGRVSRSVTMTYAEIKLGVYIYTTDGALITADAWDPADNNKAVGVAVLSETVKFVISPTQSSSTLAWGGYGTTISDIVTTSDQTTAKADYAGSTNTDKIIAQLGTGNAPAAEYCRGVTFKHGKTGYLGSLGEWYLAYQNKAAIDTCMTKISGTALDTSNYHWTSTQYSGNGSWVLSWSDGNVDNTYKATDYRVRAFAAL